MQSAATTERAHARRVITMHRGQRALAQTIARFSFQRFTFAPKQQIKDPILLCASASLPAAATEHPCKPLHPVHRLFPLPPLLAPLPPLRLHCHPSSAQIRRQRLPSLLPQLLFQHPQLLLPPLPSTSPPSGWMSSAASAPKLWTTPRSAPRATTWLHLLAAAAPQRSASCAASATHSRSVSTRRSGSCAA